MENIEIGAVQLRFADVVWENEPVSSGALVKKCEEIFGWKKSTTYTVLKKLCEKGILINRGGVVTSLIPREQFYSSKSEQFVSDTFSGSLPAFIASFMSSKKLSSEEADEIADMIDSYRKEHSV